MLEQIASTIVTRSKIPEMAIRTSVMIGFPGETDADVDEMIEFLQEMKFDRAGCFTYSQEDSGWSHEDRLTRMLGSNIEVV